MYNDFGFSTLGVVHKLRLQDEVGRGSKNVQFLSTFIPYQNVKAGGQVVKKSKNIFNVVCERPLRKLSRSSEVLYRWCINGLFFCIFLRGIFRSNIIYRYIFANILSKVLHRLRMYRHKIKFLKTYYNAVQSRYLDVSS